MDNIKPDALNGGKCKALPLNLRYHVISGPVDRCWQNGELRGK